MQMTFLKDFKSHKTVWRIQVKVLHSWRQLNKIAGDSLEFILLDANGTKIHASCKKTCMDDLASKVPVGEWINIDHFSLTGAGRTYQTTKNALRMNFVHKTSISESTLQIEENFLDLVDCETILSGKPDTNILIGEIQISNAYDASQIFINPEIEEAKVLNKR
ncbi:hypothetical protein Bca4012_030807 [Brassica carinata]